MENDPLIGNRKSEIENLLARPPDQRLREYKYRFAQAAVFGLPVVGLQYFGLGLGGAEAAVWVGLLQAILAGWVLYIAAAGMLFEGLIQLRRRVTADLLVSLMSAGLYLGSAVGVLRLMLGQSTGQQTFWFHWTVLLLMAWCGVQWRRWALRCENAGQPPISASGRE